MLLFKLFQQLLLPSIFTPLLFIVGIVFSFKDRQRTGKIILLFSVSLYCLLSISPIADLIIYPLESAFPAPTGEQFGSTNRIVILAGGGETNIFRASEALKIYFSRPAEIRPSLQVIISGTNPLQPETNNEARIIETFLIERGMDPVNLTVEDKSRNTLENAVNAQKLIGQETFFLITSAYHLPRAMWVFRAAGENPIAIPTDPKIKFGRYNLFDWLPSAKNIEKVDLAAHEYFGIIYYRLKLAN